MTEKESMDKTLKTLKRNVIKKNHSFDIHLSSSSSLDSTETTQDAAVLAIKQGDLKRAEVLLLDLHNEDPKDACTNYLLGVVYCAKSRYESALKHLIEAWHSKPKNRKVRNLKREVDGPAPSATM